MSGRQTVGIERVHHGVRDTSHMAKRAIMIAARGCTILAWLCVGCFVAPVLGERTSTDLHGDPLPAGASARLGTMRFRHGEMIARVAFSPDGAAIASWGSDNVLCVWEASTGRLLHRYGFPRQGLATLFLPSNRPTSDALLLAANGTLHLWNFVDTLPPTLEPWPPFDGHVRRIPLADPRDLPERFGHHILSPDSRTLFASSSWRALRTWEFASGKSIDDLRPLGASKEPLGVVRWMAASVDATRLVALTSERGDKDYSVVAIEPSNGKTVSRFPVPTICYRFPGEPAALSEDGSTLAVGTQQGTIHLFDVTASKELRKIDAYRGAANCVAFSPDGTVLAGSSPLRESDAVSFWEVATGRLLSGLKGSRSDVISVAFSPDGKLFATAGQHGFVRLWDRQSGEEIDVGQGHYVVIRAMALSPDGSIAATAAGREIRVWETSTGKQLWRTQSPGSSLAISPDGDTLLVGGAGLHAFDLRTGRRIEGLASPEDTVGFNGLAFTGDGNRLATCDSRRKRLRILDRRTGEVCKEFACEYTPRCVAISPNGQMLAAAERDYDATEAAVIRLWDVPSGGCLRSIRPQKAATIFALKFSPNGRWLASAGCSTAHGFRVTDNADMASPGFRDSLELWDVQDGSLVRQYPIPSMAEWTPRRTVYDVIFSPNGSWLITGEKDAMIRIYGVESGALVRTIAGHHGEVRSVAISADGRVLASASADGTGLIWDFAAVCGSMPEETRNNPAAADPSRP